MGRGGPETFHVSDAHFGRVTEGMRPHDLDDSERRDLSQLIRH
jgi:hypothetical protein